MEGVQGFSVVILCADMLRYIRQAEHTCTSLRQGEILGFGFRFKIKRIGDDKHRGYISIAS